MNVLITGTAGFIGYHLAGRLLEDGYQVTGLDHLNDYYDINLKLDRLKSHGVDLRGEDAVQAADGVGSLDTDQTAAIHRKPGLYRSATLKNYQFLMADLQDREAL